MFILATNLIIYAISVLYVIRHSRLPGQAGPLQNLNRSQVMVIGRSVSFSDPARPLGGGVGRPKHPKIRPPPPKKIVHAFQNPRNIFEKKNLVGKKEFFLGKIYTPQNIAVFLVLMMGSIVLRLKQPPSIII